MKSARVPHGLYLLSSHLLMGHGGPTYLPSNQAVGGNEADKAEKPKNRSSGAEMQVFGVRSRVVYMLYTL